MQSTSGAAAMSDTEHRHHRGLTATLSEPQQPAVRLRLPNTAALVRALPFVMPTPPAPGLSVLALHGTKVIDRRVLRLRRSTPTEDPSNVPHWWTHLLPPLAGKNTTSVAIIAHTDAAWTSAVRTFARYAPFEITHLIRVHQDRWYTLDCPNPQRCRRPECSDDGAPLNATTSQRPARRSLRHIDDEDLASAEALLDALRPRDEDLHTLVRADLATSTKRGQMDLLNDLSRAREFRAHQPITQARTPQSSNPQFSNPEAGTREPLSAPEAAVLLRALADVQVRDAAMVWNDTAAHQLWHDLLPAAPPGHLAPVATLIAVLAYRRGHTRTATYALEHALLDDPRYRLAVLLRGFIDRDLPARSLDAGLDHARAEHLLGPADDTPPTLQRAETD